MTVKAWLLLALGAVMVAIIARDVLQRKEPVLRVFPLVGWLRPILGRAGPKLRQYLIAGDLDERPFTRVDRTWVSAAARGKPARSHLAPKARLLPAGRSR